MARLLIKLTQDRVTGEKETNGNHVHRSVIDMGPKKWAKQASYFLDNEMFCEEWTGQINLGFRYSISKESKQNLYSG